MNFLAVRCFFVVFIWKYNSYLLLPSATDKFNNEEYYDLSMSAVTNMFFPTVFAFLRYTVVTQQDFRDEIRFDWKLRGKEA